MAGADRSQEFSFRYPHNSIHLAIHILRIILLIVILVCGIYTCKCWRRTTVCNPTGTSLEKGGLLQSVFSFS